MAQFRTTADVLDLILTNGGEVTNGNSPYEAQVLNYLNRVQFAIVCGGTIPLGKDQTIEIDEVWPWAKAKRPLVLELQPKVITGTVSLTQGSEAGTFSSGPAASLAGWYLRINGRSEILRIASHTAAATAFELDGAYPDTTGSTLSFEAFKLDYDLTPDYIVIDSTNNKFDFKKASGGALLTATLTAGTYSPSALATHVAAVVTTAASGPTITGSYSAITKKFTFVSDGAAASVFQLFFATGTNQLQSAHKTLGYDDEDLTGALTYTSTYIQGGIARLIEPIRIHKANEGNIFGIDAESFQRNYALNVVEEGAPDRFTIISEESDGSLKVRFNRYVEEKTRIEIDHVPVPRDLKDSAGSIPLVPRKHVDVLEDAATFYLMFCKSDDRAMAYANLAQGKLKAMVAQHRGSQVRSGENFGRVISRRDRMSQRRGLFPREPY